jgi:hypothetical protein
MVGRQPAGHRPTKVQLGREPLRTRDVGHALVLVRDIVGGVRGERDGGRAIGAG